MRRAAINKAGIAALGSHRDALLRAELYQRGRLLRAGRAGKERRLAREGAAPGGGNCAEAFGIVTPALGAEQVLGGG